ncbi:MAG TPA: 50S ribosomal protein L24 [Candidatus Cloacimonetes bacterium]|jgi:large subunit ribosomal protein L24|nr:50S ribosomal protein L24 [Candidatus Cloacimonadota bacterium]
MSEKLKLKKGDFVIVISGEDKGKKGRILKTFPKTNRVIVERVHMIKKHAKPSQTNPQGGIINKEAPIHASNVMLFNEKQNMVTKPVMITRPDGSRIRVCSKTHDEL